MAVTPTALGEVITAGDDYAFTITVTKDGATYDVTGATVTCTIVNEKGMPKLSGVSCTLTTPGSGIVTLTLTDTQTATLDVPSLSSPKNTATHFGDVKVVESDGSITHCGPFTFEVRRAHT